MYQNDFILGLMGGFLASMIGFYFYIASLHNEKRACEKKHNVYQCKSVYVPVKQTPRGD